MILFLYKKVLFFGSYPGGSSCTSKIRPVRLLARHYGIGDKVKNGYPLIVMIDMKMEYVIRANKDGIVKSINCSMGQNVKKSFRLLTLND
jgi:hypothetical protein